MKISVSIIGPPFRVSIKISNTKVDMHMSQQSSFVEWKQYLGYQNME